MKINATAEVTVTLTIPTHSYWPAEATIEEVEKQARRSALERLNALLHGSGARVSGDAKVRHIYTEVER